MSLSMYSQKVALERNKTQLETEVNGYKEKEKKLIEDNSKLQSDLQGAQATQGRIQKQLDETNIKVRDLANQNEDWKSQIADLRRERDELIAKLQEKIETAPAPAVVQAPADLHAACHRRSILGPSP